jgi:hypothetical protein
MCSSSAVGYGGNWMQSLSLRVGGGCLARCGLGGLPGVSVAVAEVKAAEDELRERTAAAASGGHSCGAGVVQRCAAAQARLCGGWTRSLSAVTLRVVGPISSWRIVAASTPASAASTWHQAGGMPGVRSSCHCAANIRSGFVVMGSQQKEGS